MDLSVCDSPKCYTDDKGAILSCEVCGSLPELLLFKNNEESFFFVIVLFYKSSLRNLE